VFALEGRRLYAAIAALYALSRVILYALGVRYHADYLWQHFHDPELLKTRLWESLLYTHAFTPFINLFVGGVLKTSEVHSVAIYQTIFWAMGLLFVESFGYLLANLGLRRWIALTVVTLFSLTPAFIYFENFLHYEFLAAALLAFSALLFHRALAAPSFQRWFSFFLVCALIAYVRTTFHLVWLVAMVVLALLFQVQRSRTILMAAMVPFALVVALYAKNQYFFGFFGTSSMLGFNLAYVTTRQLSKPDLETWITKGYVHPASAVSVYAPPEAYAEWINLDETQGIPVLDSTMRSNGQPNYNHWSYAEVSKLRMRGTRYYFAHRKPAYLRTIWKGFRTYLRPTSQWHPSKEAGPHTHNRRVIGHWEKLYNTLVHTFPFKPYGLYLLLIPAGLYAAFRAAREIWRARFANRLEDKLIVLMACNCAYVPVLSCMVTTAELSRYRLLVEAFMWTLGLSLVAQLRRGPEKVGPP